MIRMKDYNIFTSRRQSTRCGIEFLVLRQRVQKLGKVLANRENCNHQLAKKRYVQWNRDYTNNKENQSQRQRIDSG